jgi:hypothetical protein
MDEDPSNEAFVLSLLEGYGADVDGVYLYQTSYGFASGQIPRRIQGALLPSNGEPKVLSPCKNVQCKDSI